MFVIAKGISRAVFAGLTMIAASASLLRAEVPYVEPNFSKPLFTVDALSLDDDARRDIVEALAALARNFRDDPTIDNEIRMKALAIALRLDSLNPSAREANDALIEGRSPEPVEAFPDAAGISEFLWATAARLETEDIEAEDARLVPYLRDLAIAADPARGAAGRSVVKWDRVLTLPTESEPAGIAESPGPDNGAGKIGSGGASEMRESAEKRVREKVLQAIEEKRSERAGKLAGALGTAGLERREPPAEILRDQSALRVVVFERQGELPVEENAVACRLAVTVTDGERLQPKNPFYCEEGMNPAVFSQLGVVAGLLQKKYRILPQTKRLDFELTALEDGRALPMEDARLGAASLFLLDSLLSGAELDAGIAIGGVLSGDGTINSQDHGWWSILEEAAAAGVKTVIVGVSAEAELTDHLVAGEFLPVLRVQVLALDSVEEIAPLLVMEREGGAPGAMLLFGEVQNYDGPLTPEEFVTNAKVQERLASVLSTFPQHLSAKLMLDYGSGRIPEQLSLRGSVRQVDDQLKRVMRIANPEGIAVLPAEQETVCTDSLFALRRMRPKMAAEASGYCDAATDLVDLVREYLQVTNRSTSTARQLAEEIAEVKARADALRERLGELLEE